jgi:hypothetical protein
MNSEYGEALMCISHHAFNMAVPNKISLMIENSEKRRPTIVRRVRQ